jgi:small ligand-binding sensory domain FIST
VPFAAALSQHPVPADAVGEVVGAVLDRLGPGPDLAVLFASAAHTGAVEDIASAVRTILSPTVLVGATTGTVVGGDREIEDEPALALWAGTVGGAEAVRLNAVRTDEGAVVTGMPDAGNGPATLVLLADPFGFPVDGLLERLSASHPDLAVIGGLASGGRGPGGNRLVLDGALHTDGAVGVLLTGGIDVSPVVSQGCRPVGDPMIVTRATGNVVHELAGRPALDRLVELADQAPEDDRQLLVRGLHLGVVVDEGRERFGRGDFVVRNVIGGDRSTGALAVGDVVEVGTTVQFQVRDADSADEDLRLLLAEAGPADAALLFTCTGRGTHLFDEPDHDAALVVARAGVCAGMSCAGEIGPIRGRNVLHGFTASIALFREAPNASMSP